MNRRPKRPQRQALALDAIWVPGDPNDAWDELWRKLLAKVAAEGRREQSARDPDAND